MAIIIVTEKIQRAGYVCIHIFTYRVKVKKIKRYLIMYIFVLINVYNL